MALNVDMTLNLNENQNFGMWVSDIKTKIWNPNGGLLMRTLNDVVSS